MIQTINIINNNQVLAVCNIILETTESEKEITTAYMDALQRAFKICKKSNTNAATLLQRATELLIEKYPDTIIISMKEKDQNKIQLLTFRYHKWISISKS